MNFAHRNAAIWYAQDGFDPAAKGINGRRVAGESFLKGFLRHADVDEFVLLSKSAGDIAPVRALAADLRAGVPVRHTPLLRPHRIAPVGTVFFPSPNFTDEAWRRAPHGSGAWSLCGITHTTSTAAVMQGWLALRTGPNFAWDAVICTSKAVLASTTFSFDLIDDHLRARFGNTLPPRPPPRTCPAAQPSLSTKSGHTLASPTRPRIPSVPKYLRVTLCPPEMKSILVS
jgi:hypothetical protein